MNNEYFNFNNINFNKIIKILIFVIIILAIILLLRGCGDSVDIKLHGLNEMFIYQNDQFIDPGYDIVGSDNQNGYYINVDGYVNPNTVGTYYLTYQLYDKNGKLISTVKRKVTVLEDTLSDISMDLIGDSEEYFFVDDYIDHGIEVYDGNIDISDEVYVDSNVNPEETGRYEVRYQVYSGSNLKEVVRIVHIVDYNIEMDVDSNKQIISLTIDCDNYSFTTLPDGTDVYSKYIDYTYDNEDKYKFVIHLENGSSKDYYSDVTTMDNDGPVGKCSLDYKNYSTSITMNVTDKSGVSKYVLNGVTYNSSSILLNTIAKNITVRAYDNKGNYNDIKCVNELPTGFRTISNKIGWFPNNSTINVSDDNLELDAIVASYGYKTRGAVMSAALYLANYRYNVPYYFAGKNDKIGLDPSWGHATPYTQQKVCTFEYSDILCGYGLDCTGFLKWAFIQAGFSSSIIPRYGHESTQWGNFNSAPHLFKFNSANMNIANLIKPGDIVAVPQSHVGVVIGVSDTEVQVAHQVKNGTLVTNIRKSNGTSTNGNGDFTHFVLLDDFYKMYGN